MRILLVAAFLVLLIAGATSVWAQETGEIIIYGSYEEVPTVGWWPPDASGVVAVGSVAFFEIPGNGGGLPLATRCEIVDARITAILSDGITGPVYVGAIRGQPTVYVGPYRLITVYHEDAVNAGACCARKLAQKWANSTAAALPQVLPSSYAPSAALAADRAEAEAVLGHPLPAVETID